MISIVTSADVTEILEAIAEFCATVPPMHSDHPGWPARRTALVRLVAVEHALLRLRRRLGPPAFPPNIELPPGGSG